MFSANLVDFHPHLSGEFLRLVGVVAGDLETDRFAFWFESRSHRRAIERRAILFHSIIGGLSLSASAEQQSEAGEHNSGSVRPRSVAQVFNGKNQHSLMSLR